jgi:FkbM family methyltransferase
MNIRRFARVVRYRLKNYWGELLGLFTNVHPTSIHKVLLGYTGLQNRRKGFTEISVWGTPQPIRLRNATSDFAVFRQIFLRGQYALPAVKTSMYVIDAGANIGLTSIYILSRNAEARLIAVEPDSENYAVARHNLSPYLDRCDLVHAALWPNETTLGVQRGVFRDGGHWATQTTSDCHDCEETVTGCTVRTLLRRFGFPCIDLFKIDIEGAELHLFRDGDTSFLENTKCCVVECHDRECQQAFESAALQYGLQLLKSGEVTVATRCQRAI